MDKSTVTLSECDRLALIQAVLNGEWDTLQQLSDKYPKLAIKLDIQGNTPLHYAVANFQQSVIRYLVTVIGVDTTSKNHQGETATDWWREVVPVTMRLCNPSRVEGVAPSIAYGHTDQVKFFLSCGVSPELHCIDPDNIIQRPLHVAIRHRQWEVIDLLLEHPCTTRVLDAQDSIGKTPLLLAQQQPDDPRAAAALARMQAIQHATARSTNLASNHHTGSSIKLLLSENYKQHIRLLDKMFLKGVTESDFPGLRATLPTLCSLAYFSCRQALGQSKTIDQQQAKRKLLRRLTGKAGNQLLAKIKTMVDYLDGILRHGLVDQLIEFSNEYRGHGVTLANSQLVTKGKIYLNATRGTDTWTLMMTLIHEISHIATTSHDLAYAARPPTSRNCHYLFCFAQLAQLATNAKCSRVSHENSWGLDLLWLLENSANQPEALTLAQFYAAQNAETIATYIMGAFVIDSGYGWVDFEENTLYIRREILSNNHLERIQQQYAAELALPVTPDFTPATSNNPDLITSILDGCKGEDKKSHSGPSTPPQTAAKGYPAGSPGSVSTAASSSPEQNVMSKLPHHMSAAPDDPKLVGNTFSGEKESTNNLNQSLVVPNSPSTRPSTRLC